jgi:hypothetical protein
MISQNSACDSQFVFVVVVEMVELLSALSEKMLAVDII